MPEYTFSLLVHGLDVDSDRDVSTFFAAGCDDATLERRGDASVATFYRAAVSPSEALSSAIRDIKSIGKDVYFESIDPDLVSLPDIAARLDVSHETVRNWAGARPLQSAGPFPTCVGVVGQGMAIWRWADVVEWLRSHVPDRIDDLPLPRNLVLQTNAKLASSNVGYMAPSTYSVRSTVHDGGASAGDPKVAA